MSRNLRDAVVFVYLVQNFLVTSLGMSVTSQLESTFSLTQDTPLTANISEGLLSNHKDLGWDVLAKNDLKASHQFIEKYHPAFVDKENPHKSFHQWFRDGYAQALKLANQASSFEEYRDSLAYYIAGFRDGHLSIRTNSNTPLFWPGFLISYRDGKYLIASELPGRSSPNILPHGAEVIAINQQPPAVFIESNLFPFVNDDPSLESSWTRLAPFLLIDNSRPLSKKIEMVTYRFNGVEYSYKPVWMSVNKDEVIQYTQLAAYGLSPHFSTHEFGDQGIWISIPTFNSHRKGVKEALQEIVRRLPEFRDKKTIVFDFRGNTGGDSTWVVKILCAFYGTEYLSSVPHIRNEQAEADDRLTLDIIQDLERSSENCDDQELIDYYKNVRACYERGDSLVRRTTDVHFFSTIKKPDSKAVNPVSGRVYFLTDGRCFSSGLIFADTILSIPGVIHIGTPTNADTQFSQPISLELPSKKSFLQVPTMIRRNWERKDNECYEPAHRYTGYMGDQQKIEDWVSSLSKDAFRAS